MKVLFGRSLIDLDGKVIDNAPGDPTPATVGTVAIKALLATYQDEPQLSGEDKMLRWELATKVKSSPDPVEVSVEEVSLIKKLIGKAYSPMIVGQVWKMLEGE